MKPVNFKESNVVYGKDQKQYLPLPALQSLDGKAVLCWKASLRERIRFLFTGKVWVGVLTFKEPIQPMYITTLKEHLIEGAKD